MIKRILWFVLIILILGGVYAAYLWFKPHRDIAGEKAEYDIRSVELIEQYRSDERGANALYLDKVVLIKGKVSEVDNNHIKLEGGIYCNGDFSQAGIKNDQEVSIKGRVVGYDELFEEVRLDNCTVEL